MNILFPAGHAPAAPLSLSPASGVLDRLRAYGLFTEIISWKLRFFVPADASGPAILGKLLDTYPIERISEREAA